jgi:phage/plasmid-like protein (TIGR03299 family)
MTRTATWTNIGTNVETCKNVSEILTKSGLDYEVEKRPIFLENGFEIPNRVATVQKDNDRFIGIVSPTYEIYQNKEAFDFIDSIDDVEFVKAGETKGGMIYIIGKLPSTTILNDTFTPYVIFQTSHNGIYNVRATICPLRIVCQNQFAMSFRGMDNTVNIRHSRQLTGKVTQAQRLLAETATYMKGFKNTAEELAALKVGSTRNVMKIIDAFFTTVKEKQLTELQNKRLEEKKEAFKRCYNADDNAAFKGTAWGMINAFTDFETHKEQKKTQFIEEPKFMTVTFDTKSMNKFIECVKENAI